MYDPNISTAEIFQEILNYQTVDATDIFKYKNEYKESYEEALKSFVKFLKRVCKITLEIYLSRITKQF